MNWLKTFRKHRAAKQYARKLPNQLVAGWGHSQYYTGGQINSAVQKLNLDADFITIGYAVFLPEDQFNELVAEMPISLSYEDARTIFNRYRRRTLTSASGFAPERLETGDGWTHGPTD